jgi:glucose-1-phosphate thymidylyltransferase
LENCILRESVVGDGTVIETVILENSLIGSGARIKGRAGNMNIGDTSGVDL